MTKTYYRPIALLHGQDAAMMIAVGRAGSLGGLPLVGFTHVEVLTRGGGQISRRVETFENLRDLPEVQSITAPRASFGGVMMDRARVMGIVNVTPDSFSDGGRLSDADAAISHGEMLAKEGADILDVGGESTRPGSDAVSIEDELARVEPVIAGLSVKHVVSIDTRKAPVMVAALKAGAKIINDVSALGFDSDSAAVAAKAQAPVILMHAQGEPKTMQLAPKYEHVLLDVYDQLEARLAVAEAAGIPRSHIAVDPGIGFGKTFKQNLELMAGLTVFLGLGVPLLVGLSRKGYVGAVTGEKAAKDRVHGSVGGALQAAALGAHILRVHDVKATVQALAMFTQSNDPGSADF
jgi:dihydropteroate synthase